MLTPHFNIKPMKKILLLSILTLSSLIQSRAQNCTSFSAGIQATPTTCGLPNGSLAGSATGGVTPYTYLWSNGATAATLQNLSAGTYTLTVTASNGCTATASATLSNSICPKVNTAATVSNITQNGATINWPAVSCANKYRVVVKNVSTGVQTTTIVSATTFNLSGLLPSTNYQVRIRTQCSQNGSVLSQFSPIASFTTLNSQGIQCLPPSIINPVVTTTTTATINWNAAAGAVQYNIRYRTTGTTAWTTLVIAGTITGTTIQNLIPGTAYEYQIRTKCNSNPDEFSPYSAILSFTTTTAGQTGITAHSCGATNVHNPAKTYGSMTDQQGNTYRTIVIGTQEWMAENLKTSIYRNGDPISNVTNASQWSGLNTGAWCYYNNDSQTECPYGKLYNWYAVADPRNVCPLGWHVPTDNEWNILIFYLDPSFDPNAWGIQSVIAGGKMKSAGIQYWVNSNTNATKERGLSGLPGGARYDGGTFLFTGLNGYWWSSTESNTINVNAWYRNLHYDDGNISRYDYLKKLGLSVRCVKD